MKIKKIYSEALIWLIILLPIVYYFSVKDLLPQQVPIHFNAAGQPDNWTDKDKLLYIILGMTVGMYIIMSIIPLIDPKRKLKLMGSNYYALKLIIVALMSAISGFLIYTALATNADTQQIIYILISILMLAFGNYLPTVKPNYFIGIRTPWTLESEENWKKTHRFTGWVWTFGGLINLLLCFVLQGEWKKIIIVIVVLLTFLPLAYSFMFYLKHRNINHE